MHTSRLTAVAGCVVTLAALLGPGAPAGAAPPREADVRVTINDAGTAGRVISSRPACERGVGVSVMIDSPEGLWFRAFDETDRDGRWDLRAQRGDGLRTFAIVPGDREVCAPAQSAKVAQPLPAAGPAEVRVGLRLPANAAPRGRVSSPREACERGADVVAFVRSAPDRPWAYFGSRSTDDQGRYDFDSSGSGRRGDADGELTAVAVASRGCDIAQSAFVPIPADN